MKSLLRVALPFYLIVTGVFSLHAQDEFSLELFRPRLNCDIGWDAERDFTDEDGYCSSQFLSINTLIPLGKTTYRTQGALMGYQTFCSLNLKSASPDTSLFEHERTFLSGGANITSVFLTRGLNLAVVGLGTNFAKDTEVSGTEFRLIGFGMGAFRFSKECYGIFGGAFSFRYGEGALFPILGVTWDIHKNWKLSFVFPFIMTCTFNPKNNWKYKLTLRAEGEQYRIADENIWGADDEVLMQVTAGETLIAVEYSGFKNIVWVFQAGALTFRKLEVHDGDDELFSTDIETGPAFKIGIRYTFGQSLLDKLGI